MQSRVTTDRQRIRRGGGAGYANIIRAGQAVGGIEKFADRSASTVRGKPEGDQCSGIIVEFELYFVPQLGPSDDACWWSIISYNACMDRTRERDGCSV